MKLENGITLISLTIYIIGMTIVVSMVAIISSYFYTNTKTLNESIDPMVEYTKFNSFFSDEVNHENIKILEYYNDNEETYNNGNSVNYVVFDNNVQYTFIQENKGIYRNKVKICREVENCTFEHKIQNGKAVIVVNLKINGKNMNITYTLKI